MTIRYRTWLGLGGNIGDPTQSMADALQALHRRDDTRVATVSPVYRTPPWGKTDQAWFHNACAQVETSMLPEELLAACLDIEKEMKRERIERWGPRIIDIDVLTYEGMESFDSQSLTLPHPRMTERAFVLVPLNDIAPDLVVNGKSIADWAALCDRSGIEKARDDAGWWLETGSGKS
ncbi:2-amino-4-hydroxy-6-hydroxymethyldihydropteridine diphosphokinase [Phyllobacterium myrsinacearum]|uniref:2-amino-4-hydroxy-6-hydroxymethyldihydropteridine pyrophosphokinase n=1 Tax=Phyllobacterium myrsinacearum TaxID=28101 RepID=A0A839EP76_9HYPH|nr:2-amino-4-hydroxy-6-hydroxymethyldihydropteridine diphosphokinase [Phyllobacterium myrsinacearum]MBA8878460.1 2-amino-4-hydroxy-6-hydroxymethyldihydropteridine diphosphokinase [Phyllobacterium myrsinacearum]